MGKAPPSLSPVPTPMPSATDPQGTSPPLQQLLHSIRRTQSAQTHGCEFRAFSRLEKVPDTPGCFTFIPSPKQPGQDGGRVPLCPSPAISSCSGLPLVCSAHLSLCHTPISQLPGGSLATHLWADSPIPAAHPCWELPPPFPSQCSGKPPVPHARVPRGELSSPGQFHPRMPDAGAQGDRMCPLGRAAGVAPAWPGQVKLPQVCSARGARGHRA